MVRNVAPLMSELELEDFHLLSGVEHGMRFSEWVNREKLPELSGLTKEDVDYRLDRSLEHALIERRTIQYEGYRLRFEGYDALALHAFAERDTIESVGAPLGVGKESDVYEARSYQPVALKFHREGITNFRKVSKERDYTSDSRHGSSLYTARKAAEREYELLLDLYPDVSVPRPEDQNRHAIVMERMDGVELSRARVPEEQVTPVLDLILREYGSAIERGSIHADLSEYNVFIDEDGITIFDWPQAVSVDHQNASELLERDVRNLVGHFERKYPQKISGIDVPSLAVAIENGAFTTVAEFSKR